MVLSWLSASQSRLKIPLKRIPLKILAGFGGAGVQASQNFSTTLVILVCIQDWERLSWASLVAQ